MEYGLVANIDQFSDNKLLQAQQVQAINTSSQLNQDAKLKEIQKEEFIASDSVANVEKTTSESIKQNAHGVLRTECCLSTREEICLNDKFLFFNSEMREVTRVL